MKILAFCFHLKTALMEKRKEKIEVSEIQHQLTFFRKSINGYQLDEMAFQQLECHRYMNG